MSTRKNAETPDAGPRVLVCGGRDFADYSAVCEALGRLRLRPSVIIHGDARGADQLAERWARANDIPVSRFAADWKKHGRAAGPIRNRQMLTDGCPDLVVAFPGGRGTENMFEIAQRAGVEAVRSKDL